jgi:ABC-type transporter Mla maintaining outer membrane lipid asymmetry ATPase subunit MlaF
MSDPLLRFEDVRLPGDGARVTLDVPPHRTVAVIGAEASGVDALAGYALDLRPLPGGRVLVFGDAIAGLSRTETLERRRRVGYLPAGNGLLHNLSLEDNVALPLRYGSDLRDRDIRGRVRVMLALLRLDETAAARRPASATEEQCRRAAMARALAFDPALLILADPFDGLTTRAAAQLLEVARGGETAEGSRRAVFITGQYIPERLRSRVEILYRLRDGELQRET